MLRWPLHSSSMAGAEPTGAGCGICRAEPATAAASLCLPHKQMEQGLPVPGSAEQLHRALLGCTPFHPSCWHGVFPSDWEHGQPAIPMALAGPSLLWCIKAASSSRTWGIQGGFQGKGSVQCHVGSALGCLTHKRFHKHCSLGVFGGC